MLVDDMVEKIKKLPDERRREVRDFIDFLLLKISGKRKKKVDYRAFRSLYDGRSLDLDAECRSLRNEWNRAV